MAEAEKKTLAVWELERSLMIRGDVDEKQEMTGEEFMALAQEQGHLGVAIEARREWLKENDHEVTRENMMDDTLTVKEQPAEEADDEATDKADEEQ